MYGKFVPLLDSIFDQNQLVTFHRDFTKVDERLPRVALVFDSDLSRTRSTKTREAKRDGKSSGRAEHIVGA